jgi:hypothetical protein
MHEGRLFLPTPLPPEIAPSSYEHPRHFDLLPRTVTLRTGDRHLLLFVCTTEQHSPGSSGLCRQFRRGLLLKNSVH